jgi:hypothetical protein
MTKRDKEDRKDVLALLEDVADHDQTLEEAQKELVDDGVNVSAFLSQVQQAVDRQKKAERLAWKREAERNIEAFRRSSDLSLRFASMSRAQLHAEARKYASEVHFKSLEEQTDDDLRTLLADRARLEEMEKK